MTVTKEGLVPELYYSHTNQPNENTRLVGLKVCILWL